MPTIGERLRVVRLSPFARLLLLRPVGHLVEPLHHLGVLFFGREVALEGDEDHPGGAAAVAPPACLGLEGCPPAPWKALGPTQCCPGRALRCRTRPASTSRASRPFLRCSQSAALSP